MDKSKEGEKDTVSDNGGQPVEQIEEVVALAPYAESESLSSASISSSPEGVQDEPPEQSSSTFVCSSQESQVKAPSDGSSPSEFIPSEDAGQISSSTSHGTPLQELQSKSASAESASSSTRCLLGAHPKKTYPPYLSALELRHADSSTSCESISSYDDTSLHGPDESLHQAIGSSTTSEIKDEPSTSGETRSGEPSGDILPSGEPSRHLKTETPFDGSTGAVPKSRSVSIASSRSKVPEIPSTESPETNPPPFTKRPGRERPLIPQFSYESGIEPYIISSPEDERKPIVKTSRAALSRLERAKLAYFGQDIFVSSDFRRQESSEVTSLDSIESVSSDSTFPPRHLVEKVGTPTEPVASTSWVQNGTPVEPVPSTSGAQSGTPVEPVPSTSGAQSGTPVEPVPSTSGVQSGTPVQSVASTSGIQSVRGPSRASAHRDCPMECDIHNIPFGRYDQPERASSSSLEIRSIAESLAIAEAGGPRIRRRPRVTWYERAMADLIMFYRNSSTLSHFFVCTIFFLGGIVTIILTQHYPDGLLSDVSNSVVQAVSGVIMFASVIWFALYKMSRAFHEE